MQQLKWDLTTLFPNQKEFREESKKYCSSDVTLLGERDLAKLEKAIVYSTLISYKDGNVELTNQLYAKYYALYENIYDVEFEQEDNLIKSYLNTYAKLKELYNIFDNQGVTITSISEYSNRLHYSKNFIENRRLYRGYTQNVLLKNCKSISKSIQWLKKDEFAYMSTVNYIFDVLNRSSIVKDVLQMKREYLELDDIFISDIAFECNSDISLSLHTLYTGMNSILDKQYMKTVQKIFKNGWVEVSTKADQNLTIYSNVAHPFILSNYNGNLFTGLALVHEIGHVLATECSVDNELYDEIIPITLEILFYKYLENEKKEYTCIPFLVIERCILDIVEVLNRIKVKDYVLNAEMKESEDIKLFWNILLQKTFYSNIVKKSEEDEYQWINIDFSVPIEQDFSYLIGTCIALSVYYGKYSISELFSRLKETDINELSKCLEIDIEEIINKI